MPDSFAGILRAELHNASLQISDSVQKKLGRYCHELERWNRRINLTSLSGPALVRRLIVEPIWIADHLKMSGTLADIGSGNGSPAIPLCISRGFEHAHLIEARTRRAAFLRHIVAELQIRAEVHHARFEESVNEMRSVDWITLQAVHLTLDLVGKIKIISKPTTSAVWITSMNEKLPFGEILKTPFGNTVAVRFNPVSVAL